MTTIISNVFANDCIEYIIQSPEAVAAKDKLDISALSSVVHFTIPITENIRNALLTHLGHLGLNVSSTEITHLPMRWIIGDTVPHKDVGSTGFENTYLVYITNNSGEFIIDSNSYPITENTAFVFNEGILHKTQNTGSEPRLLLGPMNEFANSVGAGANILYYDNYADAYSQNNPIAYQYSPDWIIGNINSGSIGTYTSWQVAINNVTFIPIGIYNNGFDLSTTIFGGTTYYLYPATPCFLEGTKILSLIDGKEQYVPIETLRKGDLIKTSRNGFKSIELIGKRDFQNHGNNERTENRLYKCSSTNYPELTDDLYITGYHSILVDSLTDVQREKTIKYIGQTFVTDNKYRLIACVDERAKPWNSYGVYTVWHIALENPDEKMNYGIYANGGLLVETCSINFLKNKSNLTII